MQYNNTNQQQSVSMDSYIFSLKQRLNDCFVSIARVFDEALTIIREQDKHIKELSTKKIADDQQKEPL